MGYFDRYIKDEKYRIMKILYICGLYSKDLLPCFKNNIKHGRMQDAANTYQYAVLEGLVENSADFHVLSFPFLPCYPHNFGLMKVPGGEILYNGKIVGESVSYSSLVLHKPYSIKKHVKKCVSVWINENIKRDEPFTVLTYSYEYTFIEPLLALRREYPQMQIASIVTDLANDAMSFGSNHSLLKRIQMRHVRRRKQKCIKAIDKYILLTADMVEHIPEAASKNIVIEGIYSNSDDIISDNTLPKTLLYTGNFQEFAGVKMLVDAFMLTPDPSFRLVLCGSGPCSSYIDACTKQDPRIENRGRIGRDEAVRLQKSVTLLVNPRQPNGGITKFSFPSKTMEYMSSGTPMIGYRLEGIPNEYFEHMIIPDDLTDDSLAQAIEHGLALDDDVLCNMGDKARNFILMNKSAKAQVRRILDFICDKNW